MPHEPRRKPTPPGSPAGSPRGHQLFVLLAGGPALAVGGCAIALNMHSIGAGLAYGVVFLVGVAITITGVVVGLRGLTSWWKVLLIFAFVFAVLGLFVLSLLK